MKQSPGDKTAPMRLALTPFCARETGSPLAAPWTDGAFTYATDACILLRVPACQDVPAAPSPVTTSADEMFKSFAAPHAPKLEALPASVEKIAPLKTCPGCHGSGAVLTGKGKPAICPLCEGEKQVVNRRAVQIGEWRFAAHYLARLATLPGIRIAPPGKKLAPLFFVFDGGEGLLMPVRSETTPKHEQHPPRRRRHSFPAGTIRLQRRL